MKLKFLSVAVVAVAVPITGLLAANSGPTVYGQVDVGVARIDDGNESFFDVRSNASRVGIMGEENLGGLTGFYQYEFEVNLTDGNGGIDSGRDQFLGLAGDFGRVYFGRFDSPLKKAQGEVDLFNDQVDMNSYIAGEQRDGNAIGYSTPDMGALSFNIMLQAGEGSVNNLGERQDGIADAVSMSLMYDSEEFFASVAYDMNVGYSFWNDTAEYPSAAAQSLSDNLRFTAIAKMDTFGFGGLFQKAEQADISNPAEQTAFVLSAYAFMDQTKFEIQYGQSSNKKPGTDDIEIDFFGVGVEQHLSKRTNIYAILGMKTIEQSVIKSDDDLIMVGAKHKF